jgi:hypothetical protein
MNRECSRRECETLVATLEVPRPFDLAEFCSLLGRRIGREIMLMAHPMIGGGLCGTWMRTAKADYVFYEQDTSPLHQQHIVFHEVGHILRRHVPGKELTADLARTALPSEKASDVFRVLGRDSYADEDEFEAELIATLLQKRIGRPSHETPRAADPAAGEILDRITASLARGAR